MSLYIGTNCNVMKKFGNESNKMKLLHQTWYIKNGILQKVRQYILKKKLHKVTTQLQDRVKNKKKRSFTVITHPLFRSVFSTVRCFIKRYKRS